MINVRKLSALFVGAAACLTAASPARAGGTILIDDINWSNLSLNLCDFGSTCTGTALPQTYGGVNTLYIYKEGIIGLGHPLSGNLVTGLASVTGGDYLAPEFGPVANGGGGLYNTVTHAVRLNFFNGSLTGFQLEFDVGGNPNQGTAFFNYGFGFDPTAEVGYRVQGVTKNFGPDPAAINAVSLTVVPPPLGTPEPGMWILMTTGFGLCGAALRARRRRALVV